MKKFGVWLLLLFLTLEVWGKDVYIGVLAYRGVEQARSMWQATADYLSKQDPSNRYRILPLSFSQIPIALASGSIDFVILNPAFYVHMEHDYGISRIATLINRGASGKGETLFGATIVARRDNDKITTLADAAGRRLAAVDPESLGGWQIAYREFMRAGVDPLRESSLIWSGTHDGVIADVLAGRADLGVVRSDTVERMEMEGKIDPSQLKVIRPMHPEFAYKVSTPLYPEWACAKSRATPPELAKKVALALIGMDPTSQAALQSHSAGWTIPLDYQPVHELMRELHQGPYAYLAKPTLQELLYHYRYELMMAVLLLGALTGGFFYFRHQSRELSRRNAIINELNAKLETEIEAQRGEVYQRRLQLERLTMAMGEGMIALDRRMRISFVNPAALRMLGYRAEEVLEADMNLLVDRDELASRIATVMAAGRELRVEEGKFKRQDGSFIDVSFVVTPITIEGELDGAVVIFRDMTRLNEMVRALRKNERVLAKSQEIAHLGSWEISLNGMFECSDEVWKILGAPHPIRSMTIDDLLEFVHHEERKFVERMLRQAIETQEAVEIDFKVMGAGEERIVRLQGQPPVGRESLFEGVIQDVTIEFHWERRMVEIYERERYLRAILKTVAEINQLLITIPDLEQLFQKCCETLVNHPDYVGAWIATLVDDKLVCRAKAGHPELFIESEDPSNAVPSHLQKSIESVLFARKEVIIRCPDECRGSKSLQQLFNAHAYGVAILPLVSKHDDRFIGVMAIWTGHEEGFEKEELSMLQELAGDIGFVAGAAMQRAKAKALEEERVRHYKEFVLALVSFIEQRDTYTAGHTRRVAAYCTMIARELGLSDEVIEKLEESALLHDIGKIVTPDSILLKPGRLTPLEYSLIKMHVSTGYQMLAQTKIYQELAEIMRYHHERLDGGGYPEGLKGDEIPLLSMIMSVADAFDAMTTNRIYKPRKSVAAALEELRSLSGVWYRPEVVDAACRVLKDVVVEEGVTQLPSTPIEKERFAYFFKDQLTGAYNNNYLSIVLEGKIASAPIRYARLVELRHFSDYNRATSWDEGSVLLTTLAEKLMKEEPEAFVFRFHGDDFVVLSERSPKTSSLNSWLHDNFPAAVNVTISERVIDLKEAGVTTLEELKKLLG